MTESVPSVPVTCLLDSGSYHYYRVMATMAWYHHQKDAPKPSLTNEFFLTKLRDQYQSNLTKLLKAINRDLSCQITPNQIYCLRDCPRETIWRHKFYPGYKGARDQRDKQQQAKLDPDSHEYSQDAVDKQPGQYIKYLNDYTKSTNLYRQIIKVETAEADDLVAVLTKYFVGQGHQVVVISLDSDFLQLHSYGHNFRLYSPKTCLPHLTELTNCSGAEKLHQKILQGDKSDDIKPIRVTERDNPTEYWYWYWRNSQVINFDYIPMQLQRTIVNKLLNLDNSSQSSTHPQNTPTCSLLTAVLPFDHHWRQQPIQLGLCCKNTILAKSNINCGHKPIQNTVLTKGQEYLNTVIRQNLSDLTAMIEWNQKHNIRVFRISSDIFPHKANLNTPDYSLDLFQDELGKIGALARKYGQRLTFHPDHFNVIGTPEPETLKKTTADLDWHAETLDRMGMDSDSVMVVHGGGLYGNKTETITRWIKQFNQLPEKIKRRLVLENCERSFNIVDCLEVSKVINRPVVFDLHHFECYKQLHPAEQFESADFYIPLVLETWQKLHIKPKFHISEQGSGRIGHHSDYIHQIPQCLLDIPSKYGVNIDIMVEAKMKEQAIFALWQTYPRYFAKYSEISYNQTEPSQVIARQTTKSDTVDKTY